MRGLSRYLRLTVAPLTRRADARRLSPQAGRGDFLNSSPPGLTRWSIVTRRCRMDRRIILRQDGACAPLSGNDDANHQSAAPFQNRGAARSASFIGENSELFDFVAATAITAPDLAH
jgi:hypothetical protein